MKKSLLTILLAGAVYACGPEAHAQMALPYVIASSGSSGATPAGATINFTVGEPFTTTVGAGTQLTQGFQQPNTTFDPLPVHLLDFSGQARAGYNLLEWHTAGEVNNDHFDMERSTDGLHFAAIGKVYTKAMGGNSNTLLAYSYIDKTMTSDVHYYRLKQVDRDQQWTYSSVVQLENGIPGRYFSLSPNPSKGKVFLSAPLTGGKAQLLITDVNGKEIRSMTIVQSLTEIDLSAFAAGAYFFRYTDSRESESVKVVKE